MARRKAKQRAAIGVLGKAITRRSRGRCELCDGREEPRLYELEPFPDEPVEERVVMACARCRRWLENDELVPLEAYFLSGSVWSDLPAVRLAAGRMLLAADDREDPWIADAIEASTIDPVTRELRNEAYEA
ncbi:MAG TPA: hypothetical protein PKA64_02990 [Myxococcota bacterium]|nr:hypothetical protein [Myxococcota bacterium]